MFTKREAAAYLGGIIDGEGSIHRRNKNVYVPNTDYELIEAVIECCEVLGLHHTLYGPRYLGERRKSLWELRIRSRESLQMVYDKVPIRISRKREELWVVLTLFKYSPRPSREWLHRKYVTEGLTGPQIAKLADTSNPRVYKWLREYGIKVNPGPVPARIQPPSREWLEARYTEQKQTLVGIGEELGVSHTTVWRWLKTYGIPMNTNVVNER